MCTHRFLCFLLICGVFSPAALADQVIAGWIEPVTIFPESIELQAKLDTGAAHSSLNSQSVRVTKEGGQDYVHFNVRDDQGESYALNLPLVRQSSIKRHFGKSQTRPVVMLDVCMGGIRKQVEVNLVDRSGFDYQMLLGRSFMQPDILVDSSVTLTRQSACRVQAAKPLPND